MRGVAKLNSVRFNQPVAADAFSPHPELLRVLASLPVAIALADSDFRLRFINPAFAALTGTSVASRQPIEAIVVTQDDGAGIVTAALRAGNTVQAIMPGGRHVALLAAPLDDGTISITATEVAGEKPPADTGLEAATGLSAGNGGGAAAMRRGPLVRVRLDRMKAVNDTLGRGVGDELLRLAADRLRGVVGDRGVVLRAADDGFAVWLAEDCTEEALTAYAGRMVDLLGRSYIVGEHLIDVGANAGVVQGGPGGDPDLLRRQADLALEEAVAAGRGRYRLFAPEMDALAQRRRTMELDLRRAIALREFELHYQPQVVLEDGRLTGFEALIRWHHPSRGLVSPAEFIPVAEETGLIVQIGEWVLRTACAEAAAWPADIGIAVNLSPPQVTDDNLMPTIERALALSGLSPRRLELEITEGVLLRDTEATLARLSRLRAMGIRISMDDFGTGYSSLSYLRAFAFDKIKIDQSFVREMLQSENAATIVRAVTALGASLGMTTIAEGIETGEQYARLREIGCLEGQGYLISRPVPAQAAGDLIADRLAFAARRSPQPREHGEDR